MNDPFEALREPVTPADPDPGFAGRLRSQLTREVFAPSGGTMPEQTVAATLTPYIIVSDARRAMDWYVEVFGARRRGQSHVNADGTIGHAEVAIGNAVLMLSEASSLWPDVPVRAPESPETFSHSLHLEVEDVDTSTERARRGGATVEREPADQFYGRGSVIVDPFGHRWRLIKPPARATAFYAAVLGATPHERLAYRVDDIAAAVERVRAAGGHADEPEPKRYGLVADCRDDQGTTFRLWQPAD